MKRILNLLIIFLFLISCGSKNLGSFGKGVNITFDPRTVGMQIDDTIMQKNLMKIQNIHFVIYKYLQQYVIHLVMEQMM